LPTRISTILGVSTAKLEKLGAFDGFVDIDSRFHVDPHLLAASATPELKDARSHFEKHFRQIQKLLNHSKKAGDPFWREAQSRLIFPETKETGLGYSKNDTGGSGIGPDLAARLTALAKQILDAGIDDIEIFELMGLFQENVGADRISDMTVSILLPQLLRFSERVAKTLKVPTVSMQYDGTSFDVPKNTRTRKGLILVPRDVLKTLPVAEDWSDIDRVSSHNASLRRRVNPIIGATWKRATGRSVPKSTLRNTLLKNVELFEELLAKYRGKPKSSYDFVNDPDVQIVWHEITRTLAAAAPFDFTINTPLDPDEIKKVVGAICANFKRLVEDNRLSRLLHSDNGKPRREKAAQLAFFGLADAYCQANDLDVSPEADGGAGPVDFKLSVGYQYRSTVEVKLSTNKDLVKGFEVQLPGYDKAERAFHSTYLVVQMGSNDERIKNLRKGREAALKKQSRVPDLVVVDGRLQKSASKRAR